MTLVSCSNQSINLTNLSVWIHPKKCNVHLMFPERNISQNKRQNRVIVNLQSRCNFGARVLSISLTKIMAVIFDFNGNWRLYQGGGRRSKIRRRAGVRKWSLRLPEVIVILQNSVRPRTEFLIGAVKLQLSIISQMCHLNVILTFCSFWTKRKMANSDREVISFDFPLVQARALIKIGTKRSNFYTGFWNGFTGRVANRLLEKPDISGVGSYERNSDG